MKLSKTLIISVIIVVSIIVTFIIIRYNSNKINKSSNKNIYNSVENNTNSDKTNNDVGNTSNYSTETTVTELKEKRHITGPEEIYNIVFDEDSNQELLVVKQDIIYNVMLAGVIKQAPPLYEDIDNILKDKPIKKGIWIEQNSRSDILSIINKVTENSYTIDNNGYLKLSDANKIISDNAYYNRINRMISGDKTIILQICDKYYSVDSFTGDVVEYPFVRLDRHSVLDYNTSTIGDIIYVLNPNTEFFSEEEQIDCWLQHYESLMKEKNE